MSSQTFETDKSCDRMQKIRDLIKDKAMTAREIADKIFLSKRTVENYLVHLRARGEIIAAGDDGTGYQRIKYKLSGYVVMNSEPRKNVPRPIHNAPRAIPKPDPLLAAFFGWKS